MGVKTAHITVGTTPTLLTVHNESDTTAGSAIEVFAISGSTVYVGGPDVTGPGTAATAGRPVDTGVPYALDLNPGEALYAITAAGSAVVSVLRTGV
jgi:hypothetical protein